VSLKTREVVVRRIYLAAIAIVASSLAVAIVVAPAGAKTKHKTKLVVSAKVTCHVSEAIVPPAGSDEVVPPVNQGQAYGSAACGSLGSGVQSASMVLQESGDTTGTWWKYFKTGAVYGTYDLTPGASLPTNPTNFAAGSYTGTLVVTGGTGADKGITGTGTSACSTPDSVHFSCTEQLKLLVPAITTTKSKKH
jgi:hypothetical protein